MADQIVTGSPSTAKELGLPMTALTPATLLEMRKIAGTLEAPGDADNPIILGWANVIARRFPEMLSYCASYTHDSIAWCGLTVAYVMAVQGIKPPFGADDEGRFLWVDSWKTFGIDVALADAQPGDVIIFSGGQALDLSEKLGLGSAPRVSSSCHPDGGATVDRDLEGKQLRCLPRRHFEMGRRQ